MQVSAYFVPAAMWALPSSPKGPSPRIRSYALNECSPNRFVVSLPFSVLCVVDGEPSFWPHTNEYAPDQVPRAFDVPVAQFAAEITAREGAPIALKVCRFDRDDRPLHADVLMR